jgi:hypothetical protein
MAKGIVVLHREATSTFGLEKVERVRLYGSRRRVALDANGEFCTRAALTDDGEVLLRSGMTAQGYFDPAGRQVETNALAAVDPDGHPLPLVPSTLGVPTPLEGPVSPRDVLDLDLTAVYRLVPEGVSPDLAAELASGHAFRVPFNYRPDFRSETAYLVQNEVGLFALVGIPAAAPWLEPDAPPPDDAQADDDELDFEMF